MERYEKHCQSESRVEKVDRSYLERGLTALSRASKTDANHGHWGAAVIAAYYFSRENTLSEAAASSHRAHVDALIDRFGHYFEPFPRAAPKPERTKEIADALSENIGTLRAIGHNVIFATLALRALSDEPGLAMPQTVDGIAALVRCYHDEGPGSVFPGFEPEDVDAVLAGTLDAPDAWKDPSSLARHAVEVLLEVRAVYGGAHAGVVGHVLTHADALVELSRLGHGELARRGHPAYLAHASLAARNPDVPPGRSHRSPASDGSLSASYWRQSLEGRSHWSYGHKFKYPYSFFRLARRVGEASLMERGERSLRRLM